MILGKVGNRSFNTSELKVDTGSKQPDTLVKSALLTTLAGYLEEDKIEIYDRRFYPKEKLDSFLSYIISDKRAAPRKFNLDIKFRGEVTKNAKPPKSNGGNSLDGIVLFSGGLDSTAGLILVSNAGLNIRPLWVNFGQKNAAEEEFIVRKLSKKLGFEPIVVTVNLQRYVDEGWSNWKYGIIPARNFLFTTLAAEILSRSTKNTLFIYLCAHKDEITPENYDKSARFFRTCSKIFTKLYDKNIIVTTPLYNYTKPEVISYWSRKWEKDLAIGPSNTTSCYYGNNCGECKACINRAISYCVAGIPEEDYLVSPFKDTKRIFRDHYADRFERLTIDRKLGYLYALKKNQNLIPEELRNSILNKYYSKYRKRIIEYISQIRSTDIKLEEIVF
ncbi:MAG: 7-cyano-7-deazaguanine synthase [bacterium]|nr:7-cyano-7-deazaguanine synthase [bacterium]